MAAEPPARILLTGARTGIGLATAHRLLESGYEVWGTSRTPEKLPRLKGLHPVRLDLARPDSAHESLATTLHEAGPFDGLINNAAEGVFGPLSQLPGELVREQFEVLALGPIALIRAVLPGMIARRSGFVINVSSLAAGYPIPWMGPYSAAKAALSAFTQSLRLELTGSGIRVTDIQPGDICTGFNEAVRRPALSLGEAENAQLGRAWQTMGDRLRAGPPPERVARAILRVIEDPHPPPVVRVGSFFQSQLGPLLSRFAPTPLLDWFLRRYYRL